jgi:hypothetical protein
MFEGYDVAQICLNGHIITGMAGGSPEFQQKFCAKCGAATIMECPGCRAKIRGYYFVPGVIGVGEQLKTPAFCYNCGKPYPWTEIKIEAARELARELENLTDEEKDILTKSIDDIVSDSPRTTLGATRFKKIMSKVGKEGALALKEILVGVVSEAAKKMIWP